jgi:hypothetical protein
LPWDAPLVMRIVMMLCTTKRDRASAVPSRIEDRPICQPGRLSRFCDGTFASQAGYGDESPVR